MRKLSPLIGIIVLAVVIISLNHAVFADHLPIIGSIGEEVNASTGKVYVEKMEVKQISGGGKSVLIDFTFKSTIEGTWSPSVSNWELRDDKGNVHDPLDEWYPITPLPVGDISHGQLRFVIGDSVNPYVLTLREPVNFDSEVNIDVTKEASPKQSIPISELESRRNQIITNGDLELVILNEKIVNEDMFTYNIEFSIKNISEKTNSVDTFLIKDEKGNIFEPDYDQSSFDGKDIFPSHERKGNLTFELNNKPEKIMFIIYESKSNPIILHTGYYPILDSNKSITTINPKSDTTSQYTDTDKESIIPSWIKNNAGWWVDGKINDDSFVQGIQFLIKEEIMKIPSTSKDSISGNNEIPLWIKNTARFWVYDQISDAEFINALQFLVKEGILVIPENTESKSEPNGSILDSLFPNRENLGTEWIIEKNLQYVNPIKEASGIEMDYSNPTMMGFFTPEVVVTIWKFNSNTEPLSEMDHVKSKVKELGGYSELPISKSPFDLDKDCYGVQTILDSGRKDVNFECVLDGYSYYVAVNVSGDQRDLKSDMDNDWLPTANKFMDIVLDKIRKLPK